MLVSDFLLIQHEMFIMWACEVIMVCDKIWVVDCGVCGLNAQRSLLGISWYTLVFTLHELLTSSYAIAMLYPSGWTLKNTFLFTHKSIHGFHYV